MKIRKIGVGLLIAAIIGTTGITALASNETVKQAAASLFTQLTLHSDGTMPEMPEGAVLMEKTILQE